jgi:L-asparaginase
VGEVVKKRGAGTTKKASTAGRAKVVVLGTGGTIAGLQPAATSPQRKSAQGQGYVSAQLGVQDLLSASGHDLPAIEVQTEQVAQIDSKDMTHALWLALAQRCKVHLARRQVAGVVITHGTDTLEETAYFLYRVLGTLRKRVVLTGAMRPADHARPDGPKNLRQALAWAAGASASHERSDRRAPPDEPGVWVAFAGRIFHPAGVCKVHPTRLAAFGDVTRSHASSALVQAKRREALALPAVDRWPRVAMLASHAGADASVIDALLQGPLDGLIVAGTGNGTVHRAWAGSLARAQAEGVAVEIASRCPQASQAAAGDGVMTMAANPSPLKARIDLMLRLMPRA